MASHLGDFLRGDVVDCWWDSANSLGAAANPSSAGTVFVCASLNSSTNTQVGVTLTSGIFTGIHSIRVSTGSADAFYLPDRNYAIVASLYTIDGQSVNKVLGMFSIEYRYETGLLRRGTLTGGSASTVSLDANASSVDSFYDRTVLFISDNTGEGQARSIASYEATGKIAAVDRAFATAPANGSTFRLYAVPNSATTIEIQAGLPTLTNLNSGVTVVSMTAAGLATMFTVDSTQTYGQAVAGSPVREIVSGHSLSHPITTQLNSGVTVTSIAANVVTATAIAANAITAAKIASSSIDSTKATADFYREAADQILARNVAGGSSSGRTVSEALFALRNKVDASGSVATVYKTDDSTSAWTFSTTTGAFPFSVVDPA